MKALKFPGFLLLLLFSVIIKAQNLRAPAYPLITHDPYFSIWSCTDNLFDEPTKHWTGANHPLQGIIYVDEKPYTFLGKNILPAQTIVTTAANKTVMAKYTFEKPEDGWNKFEYDDKNWKTGEMPFATKNNNQAPGKTIWDTKDIWLRREIDLNENVFENPQLFIQYDDDVDVFFNGVLAYSCSPCYVGDYVVREISDEAKKALKKGKNIMAIHCKNPMGGGFIDAGIINQPFVKNPLPLAKQVSARARATQTIYEFTAGGIVLTLTFTSPLLMDNLDILSRPASYITFACKANDGKDHQVKIDFSASGLIALNHSGQALVSAKEKKGNLEIVKIGSKDQKILGKAGDNVRIDWGNLFIAGTSSPNFTLTNKTDLLTANLNFGKINNTLAEKHLIIAYDDILSVQYFKQNLKAWWRRNEGMTVEKMLAESEKDYNILFKKCAVFDNNLYNDALKAGGEEYAKICEISYRQAIAAPQTCGRA